MKVAKTLALALLLAVGLGVWVAPYLTERRHVSNEPQPATPAAAPVAEANHATPTPRPRPTVRRASRKSTTPSEVAPVTVSASAPELQRRLKPLLNKGANMEIASQEFKDGEQFATVAHAARNTEIPFMVLKPRVLDEGKSLTKAIQEFKPELDARAEAARARVEAKSDVAAVKG